MPCYAMPRHAKSASIRVYVVGHGAHLLSLHWHCSSCDFCRRCNPLAMSHARPGQQVARQALQTHSPQMHPLVLVTLILPHRASFVLMALALFVLWFCHIHHPFRLKSHHGQLVDACANALSQTAPTCTSRAKTTTPHHTTPSIFVFERGRPVLHVLSAPQFLPRRPIAFGESRGRASGKRVAAHALHKAGQSKPSARCRTRKSAESAASALRSIRTHACCVQHVALMADEPH